MTCFSSAGIGGIGSRAQLHRAVRRLSRSTMLNLPNRRHPCSGKSSRKWPPRLSLRSIAAARDRFGHRQQILQIDRRVPAGIVFAIAVDGDAVRRAPEACSMPSSARSISSSRRTMPTRSLHHVLQIVLHLIRPFGAAAGSRRVRTAPAPRCAAASTCASLICAGAVFLRELRGVFAGALAEHDQVGERIAAEPVRAVQARRRIRPRRTARARWTSACRRSRGCRP